MEKSKAFTIIELLVVVAIIAALTAIVLVNVTQYINRGKNASIKGDLSSLITNGTLYLEENGSYDGFCGGSYAQSVRDALIRVGTWYISCSCDVDCWGSAPTPPTKWCMASAEFPLASEELPSQVFCVDSSGAKKDYSSALWYQVCEGGVCQ
jgi:prepilin-type N-terminal cleavage/methylation domain-containing protein